MSVDIRIDPFPADEALRALWRAAWGDNGPESFQPLLKRSLAHVGAFSGSALIGFVNVAWDGGVHAFILDTCVDPRFRRQGVALLLLQTVRTEAQARGAHWLHVDFEPQLAGLYRQAGFAPTMAGLMRLAGPE